MIDCIKTLERAAEERATLSQLQTRWKRSLETWFEQEGSEEASSVLAGYGKESGRSNEVVVAKDLAASEAQVCAKTA